MPEMKVVLFDWACDNLLVATTFLPWHLFPRGLLLIIIRFKFTRNTIDVHEYLCNYVIAQCTFAQYMLNHLVTA